MIPSNRDHDFRYELLDSELLSPDAVCGDYKDIHELRKALEGMRQGVLGYLDPALPCLGDPGGVISWIWLKDTASRDSTFEVMALLGMSESTRFALGHGRRVLVKRRGHLVFIETTHYRMWLRRVFGHAEAKTVGSALFGAP